MVSGNYLHAMLAGLLVLSTLSACSQSSEIAISPVSDLAESNSDSFDNQTNGEPSSSVSFIFQGNANQLTLVDVILAQIYASFSPQEIAMFFDEEGDRQVLVQNLETASRFFLGSEFAIDRQSIAFFQAETDVAEPDNIDSLDVAVILAALNLPRQERNSETLAEVAGILLNDVGVLAADDLDPVSTGVFRAEPPLITTISGLQYRDWRIGNGGRISLGQDFVVMEYVGKLNDENGSVFDSSYSNLPIPFVYCPGTESVIAGWELGIPDMLVGGKRALTIPPELAYGDRGRGNIPPNATLYFEVVLREVQPLPAGVSCSSFNELSLTDRYDFVQ